MKKLLGQKPTVLDSVGIREKNPPRQILTLQRMGALARRKRYEDCSKSASKICMIHGAGNYYDECKFLGEFGTE